MLKMAISAGHIIDYRKTANDLTIYLFNYFAAKNLLLSKLT